MVKYEQLLNRTRIVFGIIGSITLLLLIIKGVNLLIFNHINFICIGSIIIICTLICWLTTIFINKASNKKS